MTVMREIRGATAALRPRPARTRRRACTAGPAGMTGVVSER